MDGWMDRWLNDWLNVMRKSFVRFSFLLPFFRVYILLGHAHINQRNVFHLPPHTNPPVISNYYAKNMKGKLFNLIFSFSLTVRASRLPREIS